MGSLLKRIRFISVAVAVFFVFTIVTSFKADHDPLHKRSFNVMLSEIRNGTPVKRTVNDVIEFKNGKLRIDYLKDKFGFRYMRYRISKDSIYTDSTGIEVQRLDVECVATDETNMTVIMEFTVLEWDIDGFVRITKNDRPRKYYVMAGREKHGKPKKIKKKDSGEDIIVKESKPLIEVVP